MQTVPINQKPPNIKTKLKQKRRKGNKKKNVFIAPLSFLFCLMGLFLCSSFSVIFLTCHEVAEKSACIIEREKQSWEWGEWGLVGDIKRGFCAWESVGFDKTTSLSLSLSLSLSPQCTWNGNFSTSDFARETPLSPSLSSGYGFLIVVLAMAGCPIYKNRSHTRRLTPHYFVFSLPHSAMGRLTFTLQLSFRVRASRGQHMVDIRLPWVSKTILFFHIL